MLFQQGTDMGDLILPALVVIGLCILGIITLLIVVFSRTKKKSGPRTFVPQVVGKQEGAQPYFLSIQRSGAGWEIFVKGQRAYAGTSFDSTTGREVLESIQELSRFARENVHVAGTSTSIPPEVADTSVPARSEPSSEASPSLLDVTPVDTQRNQSRFSVSAPTLSTLNLAQEIGEIVNEMLANSPSLKNHAVDLLNAQTEGINFVVDGAFYKQVSDIPNAEIQELIRQATREWERR